MISTKRLRRGDTLLIASHSPGKLREFGELLAPFGIATVSAAEHALPEPDETGETFEANALIKAFAASLATGLPALADDSGLEVAALSGAPGVHSARWGGPDKDFQAAMRRVHDEVSAVNGWSEDGRRANFNATLVIAWPALASPGGHATFVGEVFGTLVWPPRGASGFGYDPMFQPAGCNKTFGEMTAAEKHGAGEGAGGGLSHRARALKRFVEACVDGAAS